MLWVRSAAGNSALWGGISLLGWEMSLSLPLPVQKFAALKAPIWKMSLLYISLYNKMSTVSAVKYKMLSHTYHFQRLIAMNEESLYKMCYYSVNMRILAPPPRFKQSWAEKVWNWCSGKHLASSSASLILLGMKVGVVASSEKKQKTSSLVLHLTCRNPLGSFSLMTSRQYSISPVVWRSFTVQCEIWSRTTWRKK